MFKRVLVVVLALALAACTGKLSPWQQPFTQTVPLNISDTSGGTGMRVACLLPLTGASAGVGDLFMNTAMQALSDMGNPANEVFFFDTKGTAEGAVAAYHLAAEEKPDIILGPVFSAEVAAVKKLSPDIPVVSFTSDNGAVGNGVWTTALLIPEQVDAMAMFACAQGKRSLAVLGPDSKVGELTLNTLQQSVKKCPGMMVETISLYGVKDVNLAPAVLRVAPVQIDPNKKDLTEEEALELAKPISERVKYDALLVIEDGTKLKQLMSVLNFYDVTPAEVMVMGLSGVEAQGKDKSVRGMYYPSMPNNGAPGFEKRYKESFGVAPGAIASFEYDALLMAGFLKANKALTYGGITATAGFNGLNGLVRLNPDGTNNRLLDVYQLNPYGRGKLVMPGAASFEAMAQQWFWDADSGQSIKRATKDLEEHKKGVEEVRAQDAAAKAEVEAAAVALAGEQGLVDGRGEQGQVIHGQAADIVPVELNGDVVYAGIVTADGVIVPMAGDGAPKVEQPSHFTVQELGESEGVVGVRQFEQPVEPEPVAEEVVIDTEEEGGY